MRFDGMLKTWNADRGFGFIEPLTGGQDIFIHVSALPRGGPAPRVGERLSFEVALNPDGKKHAIRVERLPRPQVRSKQPLAEARPERPRRGTRLPVWRIGIVLLLGGLAAFGYQRFQHHLPGQAPAGGGVQPVEISAPPAALPAFRCDGRQHCSQMSSCAEAKYFLAHCPGTKMDGDHDGIPCEDQHCR